MLSLFQGCLRLSFKKWTEFKEGRIYRIDCFKLNRALTMDRISGWQDCKNAYLVNPAILKLCLFFIKVFMLHQELTKKIIGCAFTVHNTLGAGFLEKVYEQALILELKASGLSVRSQEPLSVKYRDQIIGEYFADLIVEDHVICELKAVDVLKKAS